jgi:hypothetical protein
MTEENSNQMDQKHLANIVSMNTTEKSAANNYGIEGNTVSDFHKQSVKILNEMESSEEGILIKLPQTSHEGEFVATNLMTINE